MLNFTVGPVMSNEEVLAVGGEQVPYFRTDEFSALMKENERIAVELSGAPAGSRAVFLTCSGTGAMEAAVINTLDGNDKALVIDGGSFGHRFRQLLELHEIEHAAIEVEHGFGVTADDLAPFEGAGYTALLVNIGETSTGVLYDMDLIGDFCARNDMFLIADAVSAFLADPVNLEKNHIGLMLTGSQKALACAPGIALMVLTPAAQERIARIDAHSMYFDLSSALKNGERGQTPFTPAVGTLRQIAVRLKQIEEMGVDAEVARVGALATDFRERIALLPFTMYSHAPQSAVTALRVAPTADARKIFTVLKDEYGMWVCPNGGELAAKVFRVGHIGALSVDDNKLLVDALEDLQRRGLLG